MNKVGFVCKWIDTPEQINALGPKDDAKKYNTCTTTVLWLNKQAVEVAEQRLWDLMVYNIESLRLLVSRVAALPPRQRMVRLSSEVLPCYTEPKWRYFWFKPDVRQYAEKHFAVVGEVARAAGVRLSFHPGQFTVLASDRPDVVELSIQEMEYHADMARWMGYGKSFQDFKINVHISGKRGPEGIRSIYGRLSPEVRNTMTLENEEMSWGLDDCLSLSDLVPTVLDIHHHWIREGEYIQPDDPRISRVIDSWRGITPVVHYSVSREDVLVGHPTDTLPDHGLLLQAGHKKQRLRAHSNFMWNEAVNKWAYTHSMWSDVMVECKSKNLGTNQLLKFWENIKNPV